MISCWTATGPGRAWGSDPGTVLTIMEGSAVEGRFRGLAEGSVLNADGHLFRVSYKHGSVTLTVVRAPRH